MPGAPGYVVTDPVAANRLCGGGAPWNFTIEKVAYSRCAIVRKLAPLITAIGMSIFADRWPVIIWKPNYKSYPTLLPNNPIEIGGAVISPTQVVILAFTAVSIGHLDVAGQLHQAGRAMRLPAENPRVAGLMGAGRHGDFGQCSSLRAVISAIAGVMCASNYGTAQHAMGRLPGLKAFTAAVFGGIGKPCMVLLLEPSSWTD